MDTFFGIYFLVVSLLGRLFFIVAVLFAIAAVLDWLVRTRRISPFSPIARFARTVVDPLIVPVERRVVRAGGLPTSAPWWALVAVVVIGIIVISGLNWLGGELIRVTYAASAGPRGILVLLVSWTFAILELAIIIVVLASWIRLNPYAWWIRWAYAISEPILRPLRQIIPPIGMIDISPLVAWILIGLIRNFVISRLVM